MKYLDSIFEYVKSENVDRIGDKTRFIVAWNNGIIWYEPDQMEYLQLRHNAEPLSFEVDTKRKVIRNMIGDDYSDLKGILRIQQAIRDMVKDGIITTSWNVELGYDAKNTKLSLGSNSVKGILDYDAKFQKTIPYVFHGTTSYHLDDIKNNGLLPRSDSSANPNWDRGYVEDSDSKIYLTLDYSRAEYYAEMAVNTLKRGGIKAKKVIIELRDVPVSKLVKDDDYTRSAGLMQLIMMTNGGKPKDTLQQSIRSTAQFATKDIILAKDFYKIHTKI